MNNILYSIIIPHRNIPQLLKRCIGSLPKREDLQVIVVDDGSSEEAVAECKEVDKGFSYVEFYYCNLSKGGGVARNVGIQKARGKYVMFADADDFFNPCLNEILDEYVNCDKDVVFFNANSLDTDNYTFCHRCWQVNYLVDLFTKNARKALFGLRYRFGEPWCKMIRRDVIDEYGIRFDERIIHNDTTFSYLIGYHCKSFAVDTRALYCVTHRSGSVSKQVSPERWLIRTEVFARANQFFKEHHIAIVDERAYRGVFHFLLKGNFGNAQECLKIAASFEACKPNIVRHLICFPWWILRKVASETYIKCKLKCKI